jgi:hypothetical protein
MNLLHPQPEGPYVVGAADLQPAAPELRVLRRETECGMSGYKILIEVLARGRCRCIGEVPAKSTARFGKFQMICFVGLMLNAAILNFSIQCARDELLVCECNFNCAGNCLEFLAKLKDQPEVTNLPKP